MLISFIIPCYRSEQTIETVVAGIKEQMNMNEYYDYQIILACDGSPDDTFAVIRRLCAQDSKITGIDLSRNFGQQSARMAAVPYVRGDYVVFMDDDGQHPPEGILELVQKLSEGFDIVYAHFKDKKHSLLKKWGSGVNAAMTAWLAGKPRHIKASSFFAMKVFVVKELLRYNSPSPYLLGYFMQITRNIAMVDMEHRERIAGEGGYTFSKMLKLWLDGFTSFSAKPLRLASCLGFGVSMMGFFYGMYIIIKKIYSPNMALGYPSIMATLLFLSGIIIIMLGLLGEYVARMFMTLNSLPQYVVREVISGERNDQI